MIFNVQMSTHPGIPPDSIWLAIVTSSDHTSYCHFRSPKTPQRTEPVWIPMRMSTSTLVASRTSLVYLFVIDKKSKICFLIFWRQTINKAEKHHTKGWTRYNNEGQ